MVCHSVSHCYSIPSLMIYVLLTIHPRCCWWYTLIVTDDVPDCYWRNTSLLLRIYLTVTDKRSDLQWSPPLIFLNNLTPLQEFSSREATAGFFAKYSWGSGGHCKSPSWSSIEPWWRCMGRNPGGLEDPVFYSAKNSFKNPLLWVFFSQSQRKTHQN